MDRLTEGVELTNLQRKIISLDLIRERLSIIYGGIGAGATRYIKDDKIFERKSQYSSDNDTYIRDLTDYEKSLHYFAEILQIEIDRETKYEKS